MRMQARQRWSRLCWVIAMVFTVWGCGSSVEQEQTGSVEFMSALSDALAGEDVTRVTVTLTATGVPASTVVLTQEAGAWRGTFHQVPVGNSRTFTAEAFDSQGALRYRGVAEGVTIVAGETAVVAITLQSLSSGTPFENTVPCIDSLIASASVVMPGGSIVLRATAHDKDTQDTISYAWSATGGAFTTTGTATTTWTAPQVAGEFALTLTVTDSRGAATSLRIDVRTLSTDGGAGMGSANVTVSFNMAPTVRGITVTRSPVPVGQGTTVTVDAVDADGDALSYQWSTTCAGAWTQATSAAATFTPSAVPAGDPCGNCALNVTVSDAHGGRTQGTLRVCVGPGTGPSIPPRIVQTYQSATTVAGGESVTLRVLAEDGDGGALGFGWAASVGTLGTATSGFTSSEVRWTAPACVAQGSAPTVTATVTNARGFAASHAFNVSVVNGTNCGSGSAAKWDATGSMLEARIRHQSLVLPSGKVLVTGGYVNSTFMPSAELYTPETGSWTSAGSMRRARINHTMTVLPSGKVLVAGGLASTSVNSIMRDVDLYDPQTNTWTAAAPMTFDRESHTATLLPSGKVLVIGGTHPSSGGVRIPEIYDPETNSWTPVATVNATTNRSGHFALMLPSGKILVAGGGVAAELYDVATDTWSLATGLTGTSWTRAFLLPSGRVLVHAYASLMEYDPALNQMRTAGSWIHGRTWSCLVMLPSGRLLQTGGTEGVSATAEMFDPTLGTARYIVSMPTTRAYAPCSLLPNGKVLISGGMGDTVFNTAVLFTP
ncbi:kelch-like protein [Myxococcus sp. K38C18041901]|uniref:Kelch repeat-containing protein n=1 Tax=Myxococcus guangdongensis TaxID=2906760 RepID=UPI0020A7840B|nr:kelch repeat-containing protein [Myxococcus guangdongensis]MCP3059556.1 kelch-like protein [Myxococcus guangdongensis]